MYESLFGNPVAEKCLLYIVNYAEGHINGIARTFGIAPSQVERQLKRLEAGGILVNKIAGNTKMFSVNPRLGIRKELNTLLERILALTPEAEIEKFYRARRRPRRSGKKI